MKELSIEEKAKRYDEAIERAEGLIDFCSDSELKTLEYVFHELKKSENENIKNCIEMCLTDADEQRFKDYGTNFKACLDWLEKQRESIKIKKGKNYLCTKTHKYAGVEWIKGVKYYSPEDYSLVNQGCTCYCPKYSKEEHNNFFKEVEYDGCLEKQGEQEEPQVYETEDGEIVTYSETDGYKIGEPKFKVGDWIIFNGLTLYIKEVVKGYYRTISKGGMTNSYDWGIDNVARPWTIQDAKPGDVLVTNSGIIFPFKYLDDEGTISFYVCCNKNSGVYFPKINEHLCDQDVYPTTKEQRDLLFQKMKEAGYEWDTEKLELRKIEQKPIIPKFEVGDKVYAIKNRFECTIESIDETTYYGDTTNFDIKDQDEWKLVEQKPAWSEEDERMYRGLHNLIYSTPHCDSRKELSDWLKSLKDRVQPKQKQVWGKEDEKCIRLSTDIIDSALRAGFCVQLDRDRCVDWLKSLRPQNRWRPSEEQMEAMDTLIINIIRNPMLLDNFTQSNLRTLYDDLKKLTE